jgi:hypothetical protein
MPIPDRPTERGFVLIDRTVVAAVAVVVALVLGISVRGAATPAQAAACRQDAAQVAAAVDAYRAVHGVVPDQKTLVAQRLLLHVSAMHTIVADPASGYRVVPTRMCASR